MTRHKKNDGTFKPGRGYSQKDWDDVCDNPEWSEDDFKNAKSFHEVFPDLAEKIEKNRSGRPKKDNPKQAVSIRLDADVLAKFKATGPGWQSRINDILKAAKV